MPKSHYNNKYNSIYYNNKKYLKHFSNFFKGSWRPRNVSAVGTIVIIHSVIQHLCPRQRTRGRNWNVCPQIGCVFSIWLRGRKNITTLVCHTFINYHSQDTNDYKANYINILKYLKLSKNIPGDICSLCVNNDVLWHTS